jgi:hypothetical protein
MIPRTAAIITASHLGYASSTQTITSDMTLSFLGDMQRHGAMAWRSVWMGLPTVTGT